ncbi:hypothetical protein [Aeromonas phage AerS_266]|nr:hypothetical protein [Aeromonas phage AerS_266]
MSDLNKLMKKSVDTLVKNAEIHKETGAVIFKAPDLPKGMTNDTLTQAVDFINQMSVASDVALGQISNEQYPDSKQTKWSSELQLVDGLKISSGYQVQEVVGEETLYGIGETFVDYNYGEDLSAFHAEFAQINADRAAELFK